MNAARYAITRAHRSGFTLLEVLLAISLSMIILGALVYMIDFQLRSVDVSRRRVEEAQLARALLQRMAEDIRAAVRYAPIDVNALMPASAGNIDAEGLADAAGAGGFPGAPGGGGAAGDAAAAADSASDSSSLTTEMPQSIPGLFAGIDQRGLNVLQVDVSRLPRLDEFQQLVAVGPDGRTIDHISDVKTISYYVHPTVGGLVRRMRSRASEQYALQTGFIDDTGDEAFVIAPEVVELTYRFFDGTSWYYDWNSDDRGGLPMAVEITLAFAPPADEDDPFQRGGYAAGGPMPVPASGYGGGAGPSPLRNFSLDELRVYRLVVHLPAAEPTTLEGDAATMPADTGSSSGSSSDSSSGTGGR